MQSSTAELITGLVQLVPLTNSTQLSQEAMEVSPPFFSFSVTRGSVFSLEMMLTRGSSSARYGQGRSRCLMLSSARRLQALLVLHQPETIELWNPDLPIETFWDIRCRTRDLSRPCPLLPDVF